MAKKNSNKSNNKRGKAKTAKKNTRKNTRKSTKGNPAENTPANTEEPKAKGTPGRKPIDIKLPKTTRFVQNDLWELNRKENGGEVGAKVTIFHALKRLEKEGVIRNTGETMPADGKAGRPPFIWENVKKAEANEARRAAAAAKKSESNLSNVPPVDLEETPEPTETPEDAVPADAPADATA